METNEYQIITLGMNCFPRVVLTEYNLIKTRRQGRKSMVFDLAGHSISTVIRYLNNNFEDFFNEITLNNKEFVNTNTNSVYPHDKDCSKDFQKFEIRYKNRIENFRNAISDNIYTFFIIWGEYSQEEIETLYFTLSDIRKDKQFKLIVWNYSDNEISFDKYNISVYTEPLPAKDWNWSDELVKKEKKSIDYKNSIINFAKNEIVKSGFELVLYKETWFDVFINNFKKFIKIIFSINNDCSKHIKYLMILGIKFKLKEIK